MNVQLHWYIQSQEHQRNQYRLMNCLFRCRAWGHQALLSCNNDTQDCNTFCYKISRMAYVGTRWQLGQCSPFSSSLLWWDMVLPKYLVELSRNRWFTLLIKNIYYYNHQLTYFIHHIINRKILLILYLLARLFVLAIVCTVLSDPIYFYPTFSFLVPTQTREFFLCATPSIAFFFSNRIIYLYNLLHNIILY